MSYPLWHSRSNPSQLAINLEKGLAAKMRQPSCLPLRRPRDLVKVCTHDNCGGRRSGQDTKHIRFMPAMHLLLGKVSGLAAR